MQVRQAASGLAMHYYTRNIVKRADWFHRIPWSIPLIVAVLVVVGGMSIDRYAALSGDGHRLVGRQVVWAAAAFLGMFAIVLVDYRVFCRWSYAIFFLAIVLLMAVYLFPPINNARRWIRVGPVGLQPSEFAKAAFILALSRYLMYRDNYRRLGGLLLPLGITILPVILILREPDLGTALVFFPVFFVMVFVAGARRRDLLLLAAAGLMLLPALWTQMSREQRSRVTALFEQTAAGHNPTADGYHLYRAKRMTAQGGLWGSLAGGQAIDDPAAYRLPEAQSDFVICVVGERFGLFGQAFVLSLFGLLAWRGLAVSAATREPFGRLVAAGVVALVSVEVLINAGMSVGLLPITGLSLPFLSHGGSGLLAHGLMIGLILNVAVRPGYEITNEPFRFEA